METRLMNIVRLVYLDAPYEPLPRHLIPINGGLQKRVFVVVAVISGVFTMMKYEPPQWRQMGLFT